MPSPDPESAPGDLPPGASLSLEVVPASSERRLYAVSNTPENNTRPYSPERQHDSVRLLVTCGLLLIFGYLIVFATVESVSYPAHWQQAKELLQILLPALTGIIGTVIGFYFGTQAGSRSPRDDS